MTPEDSAYVARRRQQIRYWPWMAAVLLALLAACYGWLLAKAPLYVDPFAFAAQWRARQITDQQLASLAALGNMAFVGCGLFILLLILLVSLSLWNEHRLIRILDRQGGADAAASESGAAVPPAAHD